MKYYSEKLNKTFNTEKDCLRAEKEFETQKKKDSINQTEDKDCYKNKEEKSLISREKRELADKITQAEKQLDEANKAYSVAQDKAAEIIEKTNKEVRQILEEAKNKVTEAERVRRDALLDFNTKFGPYTTHYTGQRAIDEFNKAVDRFNEPVYDLFKYFWKLF